MIIAGGGTVGRVVTSPTGAGVIAGALTAKVGIAASIHGGNTAMNGIKNLMGDNKGKVNSQGSRQGK